MKLSRLGAALVLVLATAAPFAASQASAAQYNGSYHDTYNGGDHRDFRGDRDGRHFEGGRHFDGGFHRDHFRHHRHFWFGR